MGKEKTAPQVRKQYDIQQRQQQPKQHHQLQQPQLKYPTPHLRAQTKDRGTATTTTSPTPTNTNLPARYFSRWSFTTTTRLEPKQRMTKTRDRGTITPVERTMGVNISGVCTH